MNYITKVLNNFHTNIKFTYEVGKDLKLPFSGLLLIKKGNNINTTVYCKVFSNDIYLNWK